MAKFLDKNGLTHLWGKIKALVDNVLKQTIATVGAYKINGKAISSNPTLTKADLGLGNVKNEEQIPLSMKGNANGVAELDEAGKVPSSQLPSYVDDVIEFHGFLLTQIQAPMGSGSGITEVLFDNVNKTFVGKKGTTYYNAWADNPEAGVISSTNFGTSGEKGVKPDSGKIYVDATTNKTYRWSGTDLVEISSSLALGETASTAFRGDYGKIAYDHALAKGVQKVAGLYKITTNAQGHVTAATAVTKGDITALGIPSQDTTYSVATQTQNGLMSATDKKKLDGIATGATADSALTTADINEVCV